METMPLQSNCEIFKHAERRRREDTADTAAAERDGVDSFGGKDSRTRALVHVPFRWQLVRGRMNNQSLV